MIDENDLLAFWSKVVDPDGRGIPEGIAEDIASYTGESLEVVLAKMASGMGDFKELWVNSGIDASDPENVRSFYRDQFVEAYELANWHCGRTNGTPPLNYARAAFLAREKGLRRALDFGSGIGTGSLCLAAAGCEVHSADVARQLLDLVGHRFRRRGLTLHLIDLNSDELPKNNIYDVITCFDVLEHVPDQLEKLLELESYLRIGGYLIVNLMKDSSDPERPMHISSAGDLLSLVRKTGMRPDWDIWTGEVQALVRTRYARLRNRVAAMIGG